MDNKKIGNFIKELLKSKGMNQDDLAKVLNITPQAVSKSINGVNTFDIANLKIISDLFKITIDDILSGELQTSTSFMTDQERIVRLGYNAVLNADYKLLTEFDKNERYTLHYAIELGDAKIIKLLLERGYFRRSLSNFVDNHNHLNKNLVEILIDENMIDELIKYFADSNIRFNSIQSNYSKNLLECKKLWKTEDSRLIELIYYNDNNSSNKTFINLEKAIQFKNEKAIKIWYEWAKNANVAWNSLPGVEAAIKYKNLDYLKMLFHIFEGNAKMSRIKASISALDAYNASEEILDFLITKTDVGNRTKQFKINGFDQLLLEFFNSKDQKRLDKYKKYGNFKPNFLDNIDYDSLDIEDLLFLFELGAMPEVVYDNSSSVQNYVKVVNNIILKLTRELTTLKK